MSLLSSLPVGRRDRANDEIRRTKGERNSKPQCKPAPSKTSREFQLGNFGFDLSLVIGHSSFSKAGQASRLPLAGTKIFNETGRGVIGNIEQRTLNIERRRFFYTSIFGVQRSMFPAGQAGRLPYFEIK